MTIICLSSFQENDTKSAPEGGQVNNTVANTVDYRSSPGQGQQLRDVQVVHQSHDNPASAKTSGGVLTAAAASAASSLQSAREAISGKWLQLHTLIPSLSFSWFDCLLAKNCSLLNCYVRFTSWWCVTSLGLSIFLSYFLFNIHHRSRNLMTWPFQVRADGGRILSGYIFSYPIYFIFFLSISWDEK